MTASADRPRNSVDSLLDDLTLVIAASRHEGAVVFQPSHDHHKHDLVRKAEARLMGMLSDTTLFRPVDRDTLTCISRSRSLSLEDGHWRVIAPKAADREGSEVVTVCACGEDEMPDGWLTGPVGQWEIVLCGTPSAPADVATAIPVVFRDIRHPIWPGAKIWNDPGFGYGYSTVAFADWLEGGARHAIARDNPILARARMVVARERESTSTDEMPS